MHRMLRHPILWTTVAACLLSAGAVAQDEGGQRVYNEQLRVALDQQLPEAREMGVDGGGWFTLGFFNYDDAPGSKERTLRLYQVRLWARMNLKGEHEAFFRGLLNYEDWNQGDNPSHNRGDDFDGHVERAWYRFDLGKMLRNQTGQQQPVSFRFQVGRDFTTLGTALVMNRAIDKVQWELATKDWDLKVFLGKSIRSSANIDNSDRVANHQNRCFFGAELAYEGLDRHRPFVYVLINDDHTKPDPRDITQDYEYDSTYIGGGSTGTILLRDLRYQAEIVGEFGKTYADGMTSNKDSIRAMALDLQLEYLMRRPMRPRIFAEYLFASGDNDRRASSTATVGGNRLGTDDNAFNAFGFRDTGIAFAPRISNLHMWMAGAAFRPLEKCGRLFENMEVGSKFFLYHKAAGSGPISDPTAANDARYLGWEWDVFCDWRLTSDLAWTVRYGLFEPGAAFHGTGGDAQTRQFVYTGIILSF